LHGGFQIIIPRITSPFGAAIVKWSEESDPKPAIRHGIQQSMTCSGEKEIHPQRESTDAGQHSAKRCNYGNGSHKGGEDERVREPSMTPKVTVRDAVMESNDIKVGNNRAKRANRPNSLRNARGVEAGSNAKCSYRM